MAGLTAGKLDGAMLLSVYAHRGKELGYRELLDLGTLDVSFPQGVTLTTREFLRDKRDLAKRFMAAYLDGLELFLKNPRLGKKALARFTGVKEERFLDADYAQYTEKISEQVDDDRAAHAVDRLRPYRRRAGRGARKDFQGAGR